MRSLFAAAAVISSLSAWALAGDNWPQFRGPTGEGHTDSAGLPVEWSETKNVAWKTPIHDRGWSSPVVWGDQVWMTTATPDGRKMYAVCVDKATGKIVHDLLIFETSAPDKINAFNSYASPTPAIEEGRVYVHFGKFGTACLNTADGKVLWQRRDILCDHFAGPGSSPLLLGRMLVLTMDGMDQQYLIALDKQTGEEIWKTHRSTDFGKLDGDLRKAFSTPLLVAHGGIRQLVVAGAQAGNGFDAAGGKELWAVRYPGGFSNSSMAVRAGDNVLINTGFGRAKLWAVPLASRQDATGQVKWKVDQDVPLRSSPIVVGGNVYMVSDTGVLSCLDASTGSRHFRERLRGGNFSASPISDGKRIWMCDEKGTSHVIEASDQYRELSANKLDDGCMGSPAVSGKALFLRTKSALYRIETK
ncbi:MAG: outer membrane biogenesis protein BamB [Planctomycetes bacterium ADurb.Bin126]|nr:MAG: outer membrane biogenesis protein BamB [Planctomycetes bacterium ADurb.Bin126]HOD83648.1 PQQ-binding-like beta-propeller repeat protein [Phycisphaerae bacterium]HQL75786.1 PQQ-binding-like beta-propeller repeat protein [Phycisphaerae bacterium]